MRDNLRRILSQNGCDVVKEIKDYNLLLSRLEKNSGIELMTYELGSDVEFGFKLLQEIKDKYRGLKIIIISNEKRQEEIDRAIRMGCVGYITKPFKDDRLIEMIKTVRKN